MESIIEIINNPIIKPNYCKVVIYKNFIECCIYNKSAVCKINKYVINYKNLEQLQINKIIIHSFSEEIHNCKINCNILKIYNLENIELMHLIKYNKIKILNFDESLFCQIIENSYKYNITLYWLKSSLFKKYKINYNTINNISNGIFIIDQMFENIIISKFIKNIINNSKYIIFKCINAKIVTNFMICYCQNNKINSFYFIINNENILLVCQILAKYNKCKKLKIIVEDNNLLQLSHFCQKVEKLNITIKCSNISILDILELFKKLKILDIYLKYDGFDENIIKNYPKILKISINDVQIGQKYTYKNYTLS